jgi:hypothetical protein
VRSTEQPLKRHRGKSQRLTNLKLNAAWVNLPIIRTPMLPIHIDRQCTAASCEIRLMPTPMSRNGGDSPASRDPSIVGKDHIQPPAQLLLFRSLVSSNGVSLSGKDPMSEQPTVMLSLNDPIRCPLSTLRYTEAKEVIG